MSSPPAPGRKRRLSSDPGSRWASQPEDLIGVVASRLLLAGDLLDYVRFRAVCTAWRSGTDEPRGRGVADPRFHPWRWVMLPEGHYLYPGHPKLGGYVRFLNLDTGALVRSRIPLLTGGYHCAMDSVDGLLLLLGNPDWEGAVRLLHPFTGDIIDFPPIEPLASRLLGTCPAMLRNRRLTKSVCASVSINTAGAITVILDLYQVRHIAFATSIDREWTLSTWKFPPCCYYPLPFQGKLYVVVDTPTPLVEDQDKVHHVVQVDPPITLEDGTRALPEPKLIATIPGHKLLHPDGLVECGSELLVLGHNDIDMSWSQIVIFKLTDLVLQRFIPIQSIGGNTLFLGARNISVSSRVLPTAKGDNVVYYNSSEPPYLVQYNLTSGTFSPAIDTCSLYGRAPGPSSLVHYIFSCCDRDEW
ncbi:hypothetical protein PR202_ga03352 [Eleusine coracana subsp. coracana]|uniref:KIB1-4 beta-propeller domain-containing protein n=1 Tax=Eleusine coracana subsp. coracana TaxID=191504 RepID=A0AAV5BPP2_ELECO|nr:hypothetical protein PR202_ga03352 [Eleusine coracana subsp. coracana]